MVYSRAFELLDADGFTLVHMESESTRYPQSNFHRVGAVWGLSWWELGR